MRWCQSSLSSRMKYILTQYGLYFSSVSNDKDSFFQPVGGYKDSRVVEEHGQKKSEHTLICSLVPTSTSSHYCTLFRMRLLSIANCDFSHKSLSKDTHRVSMRMQFAIVRNAIRLVQYHS